MVKELPQLPYGMSALEPYISGRTLEFHHFKYHHSYITNLNNVISGTKYKGIDIETLIKITEGPVFNYAALAWNHAFYFEGLMPDRNNGPDNHFSQLISDSFGSVRSLKETFIKSGVSIFGSGWVWLVRNPRGSMEIVQETNAGNPLRRGLIPLLNCDMWEHAYYLDYQNRRTDYLEAVWKLINWDLIEKRYIDSM